MSLVCFKESEVIRKDHEHVEFILRVENLNQNLMGLEWIQQVGLV